MPVVKTKIIRTMRDIWDEERRAAKPKQESAVFSKSRVAVGKQAKEGLAKTRKYFLEHLELKKWRWISFRKGRQDLPKFSVKKVDKLIKFCI